jgi:hypothetical protein
MLCTRIFKKNKEEQEAYIIVLNDFRVEEELFGYNNYLRISPEDCEVLLDIMHQFTEKKHTPFRDPIPAQ